MQYTVLKHNKSTPVETSESDGTTSISFELSIDCPMERICA